jgi:hypothetical protein
LTLTRALAALNAAGVGRGSPSTVISARIARTSDISTGLLSSDRWVWIFVVEGVIAPESCAGPPSAERCTDAPTSEMAILDYFTGEFLEARLPADP